MAYLEKTAMKGLVSFREDAHRVLSALNLGDKISTQDIKRLNPLISATLFYKYKSSFGEKNNSAQLFELMLGGLAQTKIKSNIPCVDKFLEQEKQWFEKEVVYFSPSDSLIGDFAHTRIPKGTKENIERFLSDKVVYIEFPLSAQKKGIFLSAVVIDRKNNAMHCYSQSKGVYSKVYERIKDNHQKHQDEIQHLVDMIILYSMSQNANTEKTKHLTNAQFLSIKKESKLESRLKKTHFVSKTILKPPVKTEEWRAADEARSWELAVSFVVRGHWRWQACGERHTQRRLIWINPHQKGKEVTR